MKTGQHTPFRPEIDDHTCQGWIAQHYFRRSCPDYMTGNRHSSKRSYSHQPWARAKPSSAQSGPRPKRLALRMEIGAPQFPHSVDGLPPKSQKCGGILLPSLFSLSPAYFPYVSKIDKGKDWSDLFSENFHSDEILKKNQPYTTSARKIRITRIYADFGRFEPKLTPLFGRTSLSLSSNFFLQRINWPLLGINQQCKGNIWAKNSS